MVQRLFSGKILITGASGFVGANLARYLVSLGYSPSLLIKKSSNLWRIRALSGKAVFCTCDLTEKTRLTTLLRRIKPNVVFHCATYGGYYFQGDSNKILKTNIVGTANLLEACSENMPRAFINTGSSSEYGVKNKPMKECDSLEPVDAYGVAKASVTLLCQQFARKNGFPLVTLRLFSPYGYFEDSRRLVASAIIASLENKPLKLSSPLSVRDFVFIDDVVKAYLKAAIHIKKVSGEIINIGSGRQYTVKEIVSKVIKISGSKSVPHWGVKENLRTEPISWKADISKAREMISWSPEINLKEGISKTISWFKENISLYR